MQWPTMSDYQDAMQNPALAFKDPGLRTGVPVTDGLGLPRPITGGFASVYQVVSGGTKWAVRCFLRHHQDSEQRYAVIGRVLSNARLPYTVQFQYLREGIRISDKWYPVLKMEWAEGEPLHAYVARNRSSPEALRDLAEAFSEMCRELRAKSIAHGDLQHGNILVAHGTLKLVDYDGMYVPGLEGFPSHEMGHPNYQHPKRGKDHFGPHLDSFSEWVIYVSLAALSVSPELWDRLQVGDEQLLFARKDFVDPHGSRVLKLLRESGDPLLRKMGDEFMKVIMIDDLSSLPPPDEVLGLAHVRSRGLWLPQPSAVLGKLVRKVKPPWVGGQEPSQEGAGPGALVAATSAGSVPSWLSDYLEPETVQFSPPFTLDRAVMGGCIGVLFALFRFQIAGYLSIKAALWCGAGSLVGSGAVLLWRFLGRPELKQKKALLAQLKGVRSEARRVENTMGKLQKEKEALLERERRSTDNIMHRLSLLAAEEQEEMARVQAWLGDRMKSISEAREALNKAEAEELARAANTVALPFLRKKASAIMEHYRRRREPLLRKEEKLRLQAEKKRDRIRLKYSEISQMLHARLAEVRMSFGKDAGELDKKIASENTRLLSLRETEVRLSRELKIYSEVSFGAYLRRVALIWRR